MRNFVHGRCYRLKMCTSLVIQPLSYRRITANTRVTHLTLPTGFMWISQLLSLQSERHTSSWNTALSSVYICASHVNRPKHNNNITYEYFIVFSQSINHFDVCSYTIHYLNHMHDKWKRLEGTYRQIIYHRHPAKMLW